VLREFSTRRAEIEEQLEAKGWTSPRAAEIATLTTRKAKPHDVDATALRRDWRERAAGLGFGPEDLAAVLGSPQRPPLDQVAIRAIEDELLSPAGLTAHASSFDRRDVLRAWADRLPGGASVDEIEALADRVLCHPEVVVLAARTDEAIRSDSGRVISRTTTGSRWSTKELLALERTTVDRAMARRHTRVGLADSLALVTATRGLPADQQRVVEHLGTSGNGVDVLTAPAGAGKTYTLAAARRVWEQSGYHVSGAALAARAAAELQSSAGIPSSTLTRLLGSLERAPLRGNTILVIDEAGMAGTRLLARLFDHAERAGAKVVLVGDPKQLPEIEAGGLLAALEERLPAAELTVNRRQRAAWERRALRQLRNGDVDGALTAYGNHERITTVETHDEATATLVSNWWHARGQGEDAMMLASRNVDVATLNRQARAAVSAAGRVDGPELSVRGLPYQRGDEVMTLRNSSRLGVRNGTRGVVESVDLEQRSMTVAFVTGERAALPADYLDSGHVIHAYATTVHKAQGMTCDRAFLLATDDLYRELGYVALSRGRLGNHIVTVGDRELDIESPPHAPTIEPESLELLRSGLTTSRAQQLAIDLDRGARFASMPSPELMATRAGLRAVLESAPADRAGELPKLRSAKEAADLRLRHLEESGDRVPRRGRSRNQSRNQRARAREGAAGDVADCATALARAGQSTADHHRFLVVHAADIAELRHVELAIDQRLDTTVTTAEAECNHYLRLAIGAPPADPTGLDEWRAAARAIERYRMTYDITDISDPIGPMPFKAEQVIEYWGLLQHATVMDPRHLPAPLRPTGRGLA
jgi:hypothetical protein